MDPTLTGRALTRWVPASAESAERVAGFFNVNVSITFYGMPWACAHTCR